MNKILITPRLAENQTYPELRECLDVRWAKFLESMDFEPVFAFFHSDPQKLIKQENLKGLLLTGGNDISSLTDDHISKLRDDFENELLQKAIDLELPVIGVCRGAQLILQYFGQNLQKVQNHIAVRHSIQSVNNSEYAIASDCFNRDVNSYHSFSLQKSTNSSINTLAVAEDGFIEAFEIKTSKIMGLMWHPEREAIFATEDQTVFRKFYGN